MKGKLAREGGKTNRGFEGGQSPMARRFPKRGFRPNTFNKAMDLEPLNLGQLAYYVGRGEIDGKKPITMQDILKCGCLSQIKFGVKLLSRGADKLKALGIPINVEVSDASKSAIDTIKATGGSVQMTYRTPLILR